jgi:hypothetical protein
MSYQVVDVTDVEPLGGYLLRLSFKDGLVGDVDLSDLAGKGVVFAPLADPEYFRQVRVDVEGGTIAWPNGADVAPESLYTRASQNPVSAANAS